MGQGVAHGHVKVWLEGRKLKGGYALTGSAPVKMSPGYWSKPTTREPTPAATRADEPQSVLRGGLLKR